jgi:signal transduction histidine kinase
VAVIDEGAASALASTAADIIQLVREGLSNIGRHAQASTCRVTLRRVDDHTVELEIDDDGVGFDADNTGAGMGLANLRARVASMDGTFSLRSVGGEGTTLTVLLPR